jgi:hypothetical protein
MNIHKRELERPGIRNIWENGRNYDEICMKTSSRCTAAERQNMEVMMTGSSSLTV